MKVIAWLYTLLGIYHVMQWVLGAGVLGVLSASGQHKIAKPPAKLALVTF